MEHTLGSQLSSLGSNLGPAINCHLGVSWAVDCITKYAIRGMTVKLDVVVGD